MFQIIHIFIRKQFPLLQGGIYSQLKAHKMETIAFGGKDNFNNRLKLNTVILQNRSRQPRPQPGAGLWACRNWATGMDLHPPTHMCSVCVTPAWGRVMLTVGVIRAGVCHTCRSVLRLQGCVALTACPLQVQHTTVSA